MPPEGCHRVRGHIRRNPTRRPAKKTSPWPIGGIAAVVVLWAQFFGCEGRRRHSPPRPG